MGVHLVAQAHRALVGRVRRSRGAPARWRAVLVVAVGLACAAEARADVCDAHGVVDPAVARILTRGATRRGIEPPARWTLPEAQAFAERHFARPANAERLSDAARRVYAATFATLGPSDVAATEADAAAAGFCAAVAPPAQAVDYVLLNGSTAANVRQRIHAVAQAVASGALLLSPRAQVVVLDGERALFASETPAVLLDPSPYPREPGWRAPPKLPTDERAMDEMLWQQMQLPLALRRLDVLFVHAQRRPGAARAQTADCVAAWVRGRHLSPGRALVVSNNPFVEYQRRVTEVLLAQSGAVGIEVSAMGPAAELSAHPPADRLGLTLDAIAGALSRAAQQRELGLFDGPQARPHRPSSASESAP